MRIVKFESKPETRMTNDETIPKHEARRSTRKVTDKLWHAGRANRAPVGHRVTPSFGFRTSFVIRHSGFGLSSLSSFWFLVFFASVIRTSGFAEAGPHPSIPPIGSLSGLGINIHFTDPRHGEMEMLAAAGFKWIRNDLAWGGTEREKGKYDFSAYDRLVATLEKYHMHAVFILDYGNRLYDDGQPPRSEEARAAFARWAMAVVSHFKGKGCLWEMWNEPNISQFWKPKPNVEEYIALAKSTGQALRDAGLINPGNSDKSANQVTTNGTTSGSTAESKPSSDSSQIRNSTEAFIGPATSEIGFPFLEACFKAGLLDYWDAVSVHPYRQTAPETVEEDYRTIRQLIRKYAPKDKVIPVLSGEWGYSTAWKDFDEDRQAKYLARQFLTNIANDVPLSIWYDWHDDGTDPKDGEHHFGIAHHEYYEGRDPVYDPKPAYEAAKTLMTQLAGFEFRMRVSSVFVGSGDDYLLFSNGHEQRAVVLAGANQTPPDQSDGSPSPFLFRAAEGKFKSRDHLGHPQSDVNVELLADISEPQKVFPGAKIPMAPGEVRYLTPEKPNWFLQVAAASPRWPLETRFHWPNDQSLKDQGRYKHSTENRAVPASCPLVTNSLEKDLFLVDLSKVTEGRETLKPGESWAASTVWRRETYENKTGVGVSLDNKTFIELAQTTKAICDNPLEMELLPPREGSIWVRIHNPTGEPANLTIREAGSKPGFDTKFEFKAGETESPVLKLDSHSSWPSSLKLEIGQFNAGNDSQFPPTVLSRSYGILSPLRAAMTNLHVDADGDKKTEAKFELLPADESDKEAAPQAARLHYSFASGWKFLSIKPPARDFPKDLRDPAYDKNPKSLGLWLKGDGKGCATRIRFIDSTGQVFQSDGPKIDWTGWRYITFPLASTGLVKLAHWAGANDGQLHYPISLDTLLLLDNVSREPVEGEISLSTPMLSY